jgi:hypothetical protein
LSTLPDRRARIDDVHDRLQDFLHAEETDDPDTDEADETDRILRWVLYRELVQRGDGWLDLIWLRQPFLDEGDQEAGVP